MKLIFYSLSAFLFFLYGCNWNPASKRAALENITVEFYARRSVWTAHFPGKDHILGPSKPWMVGPDNPIGLLTPEKFDALFKKIQIEEDSLQKVVAQSPGDYTLLQVYRKLSKLFTLMKNAGVDTMDCSASYDDMIVVKEIYLPANTEINARFRSGDVIHGAYIPQFKLSAKCVPGITTTFKFATGKTTAEMRKELGLPIFDYYLFCNNICGPAHSQMKMKITVVEMEEYRKWEMGQPVFASTHF